MSDKLRPWQQEIGSPTSRFFRPEGHEVARRTYGLYVQSFVAFFTSVLVAAVLVPAYPSAERLLHPLVLLPQLRTWLFSPSAWHKLEWQIILWASGLFVGAIIVTVIAGLVLRPAPESQRTAPEEKRV